MERGHIIMALNCYMSWELSMGKQKNMILTRIEPHYSFLEVADILSQRHFILG